MLKQTILGTVAIAAALSMAPAWAATSWSINFSGTNNSPAYGNTRTYADGTLDLTASAYAGTGGSSSDKNQMSIQTAYLAYYSGGLGVTNQDSSTGSTPAVTSGQNNGLDGSEYINGTTEHAMDNNQRYDVILLSFDQAVALQSLKLGWVGSDSDVSVLAWTGAGSPNLLGSNFATVGADAMNSANLGWNLIGNLPTVGTASPATFNGTTPTYASYWLVAAGVITSAGLGHSDDMVKLASIGGLANGAPPIPGVPEPGSLALMGVGLASMLGLRRRQSA